MGLKPRPSDGQEASAGGVATSSARATQISLAELQQRLAAQGLDKECLTLVQHALKWEDASSVALWIEGAWRPGSLEGLQPSPQGTAVVVFASAIDTADSLIMRYEDLLGFSAQRNQCTFVFLDSVRCHDFISVPDALSILAKGLEVSRVASFDGGDAHTQIAGYLRAPFVVSNLGGGTGYLSSNTRVEIGAYARYIGKLPKSCQAKSFDTLAELFPSLLAEEDDGDAWELLVDCVGSGREF